MALAMQTLGRQSAPLLRLGEGSWRMKFKEGGGGHLGGVERGLMGNVQSAEQEDEDQAELGALVELHGPHDAHGQEHDDDVGQDVGDAVDPERRLGVDAVGAGDRDQAPAGLDGLAA